MPLIPHKIKVGYRDYVVQPMQPEEGADTHLGLHYGEWGIISINFTADPPFPDTELVCTLVHEIFHAIVSVQGHDYKEEEKLVNAMANGWVQIIQDNPHLITWLVEKLHDPTKHRVPEDGLQEPSGIQCLPVPKETSVDSRFPDRV